jgi:membrane-associated phospholipid phosphatase
MPGFLESQIPVNLFFQSLGHWLTPAMKFFSFLGQEEFFIAIILILYWGIDSKAGFKAALLLLVSNGLNLCLKIGFHAPRPFWINSQVKAFAGEPTFGFPSGHTQNSSTVWSGMIFPSKRWLPILGVCLLVLLIAISRLYLGMHFLIDVIGGWTFGLITVAVYLAAEKKVESWISHLTFSQLMLISAACSVLVMAIFFLIKSALAGWSLPPEWVSNANNGFPGEEIDPLSSRGIIKTAGTLLGLLGGAAWINRKHSGFLAMGTISQKLQRFALGGAGLLVLYAGLGLLLPKEPVVLASILLYSRYALVGFWISGFAPYLFQKFHLVSSGNSQFISA